MTYDIAPLFCRPWTLNGLTPKLIESHYEHNYGSAVVRLNAVMREIDSLASGSTAAGSREFARLKQEEYALLQSALLHEIYFASLGGDGRTLPEVIGKAVTADFGSIQRWRDEFINLARALSESPGWVLLSYLPRTGKLINHSAEGGGPAAPGSIPVLALDMHEHAYHLDFGANAEAYIAAFMRNIDWRAAEARYNQAKSIEPPPRLAQEEFSGLPSVSVEEVRAMRERGEKVQIIDTRPRHYAARAQDMIEGAVWRDPERLQDWIGELSKDEPVVTFCVYGFHIGCQTAGALREAGFDAKYMAGGHYGWKALQGPMQLFTGTR